MKSVTLKARISENPFAIDGRAHLGDLFALWKKKLCDFRIFVLRHISSGRRRLPVPIALHLKGRPVVGGLPRLMPPHFELGFSHPALLSQLTGDGKSSLCGILLKGECKIQQRTNHSLFFFVGSEKILSDTEKRLGGTKLLRIWPSDYWLP